MAIKVETEAKYYCLNPRKMIEKIKELDYEEIKVKLENDEYFTDINSEFIDNRTCLRIRKTDQEKMEVTFKGKSQSSSGLYCKLENNINADIKEYENYIKLFTSLGYYSYVNVAKERLTFVKKDDKYTYSIMIDKLPSIGGFVEFEVLADQDEKKEDLKIALKKFIEQFDMFNLKEENRPYRDVVAESIYNKYKTKEPLVNIYLNIDDSINKYEKDFYKKYKELISKEIGYQIKWGMYKKNPELYDILKPFIQDYLDNFIYDSKELLVTIELLKKSGYNKHFITKINKAFFEDFFKKLNIEIENTIYVKDETMPKIIKSNNINLNNSIIFNVKDLKEIISTLLIIENIEKENLKKYKALLLDLDGTLINSEQAFYEAFKKALEDYGVSITKEEYNKYELKQNAKLIHIKKEEYPILIQYDDDEINAKIHDYYMKNFKKLIEEKEVKETFDLIKQLKEKNIKICLVTTSKWMYINMILELYKLNDTFDYIIGREDLNVSELKPNPKAYNMTLDKVNLKPEECICIEDSKRGVDAALKAGIETIKVDNYTDIKYHDKRVKEEPSATEFIKKLIKIRN